MKTVQKSFRCKRCKKKSPVDNVTITEFGTFCSDACALEYQEKKK